MFNKIKIPVLIILIVALGFGGYFAYTDMQNKKTNKEFVFDVVKSLNEIHKSRGSGEEDDKNNEFRAAYSMKERVENAEKLMKKWGEDENSFRRDVAQDMLAGITNLSVATDAYITLLNRPNKEDLARFQVKLEEGRKQLWLAASGIVLRDGGIRLSRSQKQEVIDFIDRIFEKEIETFKEKGQEEDFSQPQEIWAAVIIRNGLSK